MRPDERQALVLALLERAGREGACPGRDADVRAFVDSPGSLDPGRWEHLSDCLVCGVMILSAGGADHAAAERSREAVLRTLAPAPRSQVPPEDGEDLLPWRRTGREEFVKSVLAHPPFAAPPPAADRWIPLLPRLLSSKRAFWLAGTAAAAASLRRSGVEAGWVGELPPPDRGWDLVVVEAAGALEWLDACRRFARVVPLADALRHLRDAEALRAPRREVVDGRRDSLILDRLLAGGGPSIVFAAGDRHARRLCEGLRRRSPSLSADWVGGETPYRDRLARSRDLASGRLRVVFDGDPGPDAPTCAGLESLFIARPAHPRMVLRALPALAVRRVRLVEFRHRGGGGS